jgi:hypothetical protein
MPNAISPQPPRPSHEPKPLARALASLLAISSLACVAGVPAIETAPRCPTFGLDEANGLEVLQDRADRQAERDRASLSTPWLERELTLLEAPLLRWIPAVVGYCDDVLPAWLGE